MPQTPHPFDEIADEITSWLTEESDYYVEALKGGHRSPFSADVSERDKRAYYERQVFMQNPDGSINYEQPNKDGRDMLIKRVGIKGYTDIMATVMPRQRPGLQVTEEEDEDVGLPAPPSDY